jgi:hypothetical protein
MPVGRPPIYETVDDILPVMQEWLDSLQRGEKPTITGLCIALGFESKDTLYAYRDKPEFSYPIKKCLLFVENGYEKALRENAAAGSIFALKNMGWKDKTEVDNNISGGLTWKEERTYETDKEADHSS